MDQLRLHFDLLEPENCPQYRAPGAADYAHPKPWIDAHNKGGWEFPDLLPTTEQKADLVRRITYLDREIRQYRRQEVEGTPHEASVVKAILRSVRHVIILMSNWQLRLERGIKLSVDDIHERFQFAHHAQQYRQQLAAWRHMRDRLAPDLPTSTVLSDREIPWNDIFDAVRRLRLRTGATPSRWSDRREDLEVAQEVISELGTVVNTMMISLLLRALLLPSDLTR